MAGILAIEADRKRQTLLRGLIREHAQTEVTMVGSVKAAIASFAEHQPDLIVAPTLLSPQDSDQLISHVKEHAGPHVQMLTIPALDILRESPPEETRRFGFPWQRQRVNLGLQYDPGIVGKLIADRLERARTLRVEQPAALEVTDLVNRDISLAMRPVPKTVSAPTGAGAKDRRWARRTPPQDVPWLSTVKLPWGTDVEFVNISQTGVLLKSKSKLSPGVTLELRLTGPGVNQVVMARFIRSDIAHVDHLGVRYYAAAQFEQPLELLAPQTESVPCLTPKSLAVLLTRVLSESNLPEPATIRFARGLRDLIGARDVLIRRGTLPPVDDSESTYFSVNGDGASRTILQVMFEQDRPLTVDEFRLLKVAAGVTAAVFELERLPAEDMRPVRGRMSEVA